MINILHLIHLNGVAEGGGGPNLSEHSDSILLYGESLRAGPDLDDLHHLLLAVGKSSDDQKPVQQVAGNAMGTADIRAADSTVACFNQRHENSHHKLASPLLVAKITMGAIVLSSARWR